MEEEQTGRSNDATCKMSPQGNGSPVKRVHADRAPQARLVSALTLVATAGLSWPWWGLAGEGHSFLGWTGLLFLPVLGIAGLMWWQSRRWGDRLELSPAELRTLDGERTVFTIAADALTRLELGWTGLVVEWIARGGPQKLLIPCGEFSQANWKSLEVVLRGCFGGRLRDTRRTLSPNG